MQSKRYAAAVLGLLLSLSHMPPGRAFTVYVSNEKDNTVTVIDSESLEVVDTLEVGQRPRGIILTKDGSQLLVCASDDDTIEVIDVATRKIVRKLPSGPDPELLILHPSGNPLYVANEDDNLITVIDLEAYRVLAEVPVGVEPEGMGSSPDGKVLVNTSEVEKYLLVGRRVWQLAFTPDEKLLFTTNGVSNDVSVIDLEKRRVRKSIGVGRFPWGIVVSAD